MPNAVPAAELIGRIYQAGLGPGDWRPVLEGLAGMLRGSAAVLVPRWGAGDGVCVDVVLDHGVASSAACPLHEFKEWGQALMALPEGSVVDGEALLSDEVLLRSWFYREWLRPRGLRWSLHAVVSGSGTAPSALAIFRRRRQRPFGDGEIACLAGLVPHLRWALAAQWSRERAERSGQARSEVLSRLPVGLILLDRAGRVLETNRAADRILERADGLRLAGDRLRADEARESLALRRLIARSAGQRSGRGTASLPIERVARPSGRRDLVVMACALESKSPSAAVEEQPALFLLVSDPEGVTEIPHDALQHLYDLTPAEARLAAALAAGWSLDAIAADFRLSPHTVRNQLKRLFAKTGTNRQSDLLRLLLATFGPLRADASRPEREESRT